MSVVPGEPTPCFSPWPHRRGRLPPQATGFPPRRRTAPAVVLAAAAARTKRIRLTSAVSVLSTDDPVRVFQSFATLDLLSAGRAEIMVGRGSFTESFALFGYDLADYDALFDEKLDLLLKMRAPTPWPRWRASSPLPR
ncbi:LLM class flavin-dependent oxidoreductase [Geochorda subterranea]|uniref:LLM class flavin-dependent oxidoreductase n=1 Tax=Geochorda subterranea TaxID=3109564 RepID=A0ABZ1BU31_9FIRM|nr:LLM class flavin-dependent oxidoreductase [Limnochorda sp. LNt]WRP15965.1 LLM class flavin-dependent oxidoreductase [Limnochorda sp. LNt]